MKSIVVYKMIIATGLLVLATMLEAQKPGIDLISSYQQYRHPEAMVDTSYAMNPLVSQPIEIVVPRNRKINSTNESEHKRRRQLGPSLDTIFQKEKNKDSDKEMTPVKISFFNRKYNPLKSLIYITTIK